MSETDSLKETKPSKGFVSFCTFLIFSYPFYASNILPMRVTLAMFLLGSFFIAVCYVRKGWFQPKELRSMALWIAASFVVLFSFMLADFPYEYSRFFYPVCLVVSIACMLMCSGFKGWILIAIKTVCIMLIPFALGTIFIYVFPETFPAIKSVLFPESVFATGYKSGLTTHYSYNGTYNIVGFLFALGLAAYSQGSKRMKRFWAVVAIVFFFALLLIGKRQTLLFGAFAIVFVYLLSNNKNKIRTLLLGGVALCVVGLVAMWLVPGIEGTFIRFFSSFGSEDIGEVTSSRDVLWSAAASGWLERPLLGNGWGTFSYEFSATNTVHVAHNELLDLLYGVGVLGAAVFVVCIFGTVVISIRVFRGIECSRLKTKLPHARVALAISLMLQVYDISMSFSIGSLFGSPTSFMPYLLVVGIALCYYRDIGVPAKNKARYRGSKPDLQEKAA